MHAEEQIKLQRRLNLTQSLQERDISGYGAISRLSYDPVGRLWLATRSGLLAYDGQRSQRFTPTKSRSGSHTIIELDASDGESVFMLTADFQLHRLTIGSNTLTTLDLTGVLTPTSFNVGRWFAESDKIWLIGGDELRYVDKQQMKLVNTGVRVEGKISRYQRDSAAADAALLVFSAQGQLWRWQQGVLTALAQLPQQKPAEELLMSAHGLFILQNKQLWRLQPGTWQAQLLLDIGQRYGGHPFNLAIYGDTLWISGHQIGLLQFDLLSGQHQQFTPDNSMLGDNDTSTLLLDPLDNLWVGSVGHGLFRLSLRHQQVDSWQRAGSQPLALKPLLALSLQQWLISDPQQRLWIWQQEQQQLTALPAALHGHHAVRYSPNQIIVLSQGGYFVLHWPSGQFSWHPLAALQTLPFPRIQQAAVAPDGTLYLSTFAGIAEIAKPGQSPRRWLKPLRDDQQSLNYTGMVLLDDQLWLSTRNDGLVRVALKTQQWQRYQSAQLGLGNQIFGVVAEQRQLWLATDVGAARINVTDPNQLQRSSPVLGALGNQTEVLAMNLRGNDVLLTGIQHIWWYQQRNWQSSQLSKAHGLTLPMLPNSSHINDNALWFGSGAGLNRLELRTAPKAAESRFHVARLQTFQRQLDSRLLRQQPIQLHANEQQFRLLLGGLASMPQPELQYQFRAREWHNQWSAAVNQPQFDLFNLPWGPLHLEIRWQHNGEHQLKPLALSVQIASPWYRSQLAYAGYSLLLLSIALLFWQQWQARQALRQQYLQQLEQQEQQLRLALWGSGDQLWDWQLEQGQLFRRYCAEDGQDHIQVEHFDLNAFLQEIHPDDQQQTAQALTALLMNQQTSYQATYRRRDATGQWCWLLDKGRSSGRGADGRINRLSGTLQNIQPLKAIETELQQMNNQLESLVNERTAALSASNAQLQQTIKALQSTRDELRAVASMAMLGRMVAGVSHELNTPLGVVILAISSMADVVREQQQLQAQQRLSAQLFADMQQQLSAGCTLAMQNLQRINQLLSVFKKLAVNLSGESVSQVHLPTFWRALQNDYQPILLAHQANLRATVVDDTHLLTYSDALTEIMHQLINNSLHHAQVTTSLQITVQLRQRGNQCLIRLGDNGQPIARHLRQQMFEPFMTGNRSKGHAGLGLTLVYNLVTQLLHGQLRYHVAGSQGWFTIRFYSQRMARTAAESVYTDQPGSADAARLT